MAEKLKFVIKNMMDGTQVGYYDWGPERDYLFDELNVICQKRKNKEAFNLKEIQDIYEKDPDFFPALVMMGEICLNLKRFDKAGNYLTTAIRVAEKLIPIDYDGKIYSVEEPSYYSALNGIIHIENEKDDREMADKCMGIWIERLPDDSFSKSKSLM